MLRLLRLSLIASYLAPILASAQTVLHTKTRDIETDPARTVAEARCAFGQPARDPRNSHLVGWWTWLLPPILWRLSSNAPPNASFGLVRRSKRETPMQTGFEQKA